MGAMVTPGAPLGAAIVGAAVGIGASSQKFREWIFGKKDEEDGKRKGGLVQKFGNYVQVELLQPMKSKVMDIVELDAASNNGVNDIREICDSANFTPAKAKYRVYIIDEVHMLSQGAFNALLKTLEEPPSHVIFILATTEAHKIPATILSRCQRFEFNKIKSEDIKNRLLYIAGKENIELSEKAASIIARLSDG